MQLGDFVSDLPVLLAPMAGVTDLPMRQLAVKHGADIAVGEMMSSDPTLAHSRKTQSRAVHSNDAGLRSVQLVGNDPETIAQAARFNVERGAEIIDINMGCPAKKVCKKAAGSALLADTGLVSDILKSTVQAVSVPVTLKIRTGIDRSNKNGVEIAEIAQDCGIAMLTVHGRTRADKFNGEAEYETLRNIVKAVDIPIIANGDIDSAEKAARVLDNSGASGVMIGRAAQGRLWLPGQIAGKLRHGIDKQPCAEARLRLVREHCRLLYDFHGAVMGFKIARKHVGWFFEAELYDDYLPFKRAFNALASQDAQEQFLSEESNRILKGIEAHEKDNPHHKIASEESIAA
jgi:tRNA-dihydrouridine synthase B